MSNPQQIKLLNYTIGIKQQRSKLINNESLV